MFHLLLAIYILIHTIIRVRGKYLIYILVDNHVTNTFYSNHMPQTGDVITLDNNKTYLVTRRQFRKRKLDERIYLHCTDLQSHTTTSKPVYEFTGPPTNPTTDPDKL